MVSEDILLDALAKIDEALVTDFDPDISIKANMQIRSSLIPLREKIQDSLIEKGAIVQCEVCGSFLVGDNGKIIHTMDECNE